MNNVNNKNDESLQKNIHEQYAENSNETRDALISVIVALFVNDLIAIGTFAFTLWPFADVTHMPSLATIVGPQLGEVV